MKREVIQGDAEFWLNGVESLDAVITSLPDREETTYEFPYWKEWYVRVVKKILEKTETYAIFYQTDRKTDGELLSKSALLFEAARQAGVPLRWHKIVLRRDEEKVDLFRPTYTHFVCFSKTHGSGKAIPDVFPRGKMIYKNAMGLNAAKIACDFIRANSAAKTIYDPFCGQGSILAIANMLGFDSVGVEILPEFCEKSRALSLSF